MPPVPLAPYVTRGVLYPHLDALQLAQQSYQAVLRVSEEQPRVSLVSTCGITLATAEKWAWGIYLRTPLPMGPLSEYEVARREVTLVFKELRVLERLIGVAVKLQEEHGIVPALPHGVQVEREDGPRGDDLSLRPGAGRQRGAFGIRGHHSQYERRGGF